MSRQRRARADRAAEKSQARKRAGLTRAELDRQYREALARNPQANRSGGRGGPVPRDDDEDQA